MTEKLKNYVDYNRDYYLTILYQDVSREVNLTEEERLVFQAKLQVLNDIKNICDERKRY